MKNVLALPITFTLLSCTGIHHGTYLDDKNAHVILPCPADNIDDPRQHAFLAIQASLADTDWVIEQRITNSFQLVARKCQPYGNVEELLSWSGDFLSWSDEWCVSIHIFIMENSQIYIVRSSKHDLYKQMVRRTKKWIGYLERNYAELRCYGDTLLEERIVGQKPID